MFVHPKMRFWPFRLRCEEHFAGEKQGEEGPKEERDAGQGEMT